MALRWGRGGGGSPLAQVDPIRGARGMDAPLLHLLPRPSGLKLMVDMSGEVTPSTIASLSKNLERPNWD